MSKSHDRIDENPLHAIRCPMNPDFDPLNSEYLADPYSVFSQLRAKEPVFYSPALDMWVATRYKDIDAILRNSRSYSAKVVQDPLFPLGDEAQAILAEGFRATETMSNSDPPKHTRIRAHCNKAFSARRIRGLEPMIRATTERLITDLQVSKPANIVSSLAFPLPAETIFTLIGFPSGHAEMLKAWCDNRLGFTWGRPTSDEQAVTARNMVKYWNYCESFVSQRLADPRDDFTSDLLRIHLEDPEELSFLEIANIIFGLSFAGHETTTNLISNTVRQLLSQDGQWSKLCAKPSLIQNAVEEALRFDSSVVAWRRVTTEEVELGGLAIPEGAKMLLMLGSGNRDPEQFESPEEFDLERTDARNHISFGKGIHFCLGAPLARLQVQIVLELLTDTFPDLSLVDGQAFEVHPNVSFRGPKELWVDWGTRPTH